MRKDLLNMPKAKGVLRPGGEELHTWTLSRLANFETLAAKQAEAARQQAANNARSKDHLTATGSQRAPAPRRYPRTRWPCSA